MDGERWNIEQEDHAEKVSLETDTQPNGAPSIDVPDDYFADCASYLDVFDRLDRLVSEGKGLRYSPRTVYSAEQLSRHVWQVVRTVRENPYPLPLRRAVIDEWLGSEGVARQGGLRAVLVDLIERDLDKRSEDLGTAAEARRILGIEEPGKE